MPDKEKADAPCVNATEFENLSAPVKANTGIAGARARVAGRISCAPITVPVSAKRVTAADVVGMYDVAEEPASTCAPQRR